MKTKICSNPDCSFGGTPQSLSSFYKQSSRSGRLSARCKTCIKSAVKAYSKTEAGKETSRRASKKFKATEHGRKYAREWMKRAYHERPGYKEKMLKRNKDRLNKYRETTPPRYRRPLFVATREMKASAHDAVKYATRVGNLPKANTLDCIVCGKNANQYHHNKGYEKEHWLDVIPLCQKCHDSIHGL